MTYFSFVFILPPDQPFSLPESHKPEYVFYQNHSDKYQVMITFIGLKRLLR